MCKGADCRDTNVILQDKDDPLVHNNVHTNVIYNKELNTNTQATINVNKNQAQMVEDEAHIS